MTEPEGDIRPEITGIITCTGKETWDFTENLPLKGKVEIYMAFIIIHIKS